MPTRHSSSVPTAELISKPYAEKRRKLIELDRPLTRIEHGDPKLGKSDTIYLCVVDKDRNCVSLIQSNYMGFGSGLVPGELGFALQNRGTLFALDEKHPNRLEPGKRPFHTIIPALVTKDGKPWLVFGVMGGDMQPQGQVEVLVNLIDFGMNVQEAGEAPRIEHVGSARPTGIAADPDGGTVQAELGLSDAIVSGLIKARPQGRAGAHQRRRLPGDPDRPRHGRAARRLRSAQGRGGGRVLARIIHHETHEPHERKKNSVSLTDPLSVFSNSSPDLFSCVSCVSW